MEKITKLEFLKDIQGLGGIAYKIGDIKSFYRWEYQSGSKWDDSWFIVCYGQGMFDTFKINVDVRIIEESI